MAERKKTGERSISPSDRDAGPSSAKAKARRQASVLGDGMRGTAPTCVTHTGTVITADEMSTGDHFISLIAYGANA